jgi:hypothetical protein
MDAQHAFLVEIAHRTVSRPASRIDRRSHSYTIIRIQMNNPA